MTNGKYSETPGSLIRKRKTRMEHVGVLCRYFLQHTMVDAPETATSEYLIIAFVNDGVTAVLPLDIFEKPPKRIASAKIKIFTFY